MINCTYYFSDLSENQFTTLQKDTFKGLTYLTELDISYNRIDFLPSDIFHDLDSLYKL